MKLLSVSAFLLAITLAGPLAAAEFSTESAGPVPEGVPEALKAAVAEEGIRVKKGDAAAAEFWMRKNAFEGEGVSELGVRNDFIPLGSFLGLVRFPENGHDFRDQLIPAGIYTMRFYLQPVDGNHYEPVRDFTLLSPLEQDPNPEKNVSDYDALIDMSYEVGNPHPTIMHMAWSEGDETPNLWENDYGHWVVDLKVGGEPIGFVIDGHAEE